MQYANQSDWSDGMRALKVISKHLHKEGRTLLTKARMLDDPDNASDTVTLPAFTPFSIDNGQWAAAWSVPRTLKDLDEVVAVYEEYADRKLGALRNPCQVARRVFQAATSRKFFGPARRPWDWWRPAAQLVALASQLSKTPAKVQGTRVLLEVGGYRMEVTRRGCYSNFRKRVVDAQIPAEDADISLLTLDALTTAHPLARALAMGMEPTSILWAANAAIRAEAAGRIAPILAHSIEFLPPRSRGRNAKRHSEADARGALHACRDTLENGGPGILPELYQHAVPVLMNHREFAEVLASPWNRPGRTIGQASVQRMQDHLDQIERAL